MTHVDVKKHEQTSGIHPLAAAVTGAVVGAGVVVAGAAMLKDEGNRKKVKKAFKTIKRQAIEHLENIQDTAKNTTNALLNEEGKVIKESN